MLSDSIFVQGKRLRSNAISRCTPFPSFRLASIPFSRTKFSRSDLLIIPLFFFEGEPGTEYLEKYSSFLFRNFLLFERQLYNNTTIMERVE